MGLGTMNTHVRTMAAGSLSGTMLAVNLTLIPAGRRVCSTNTKYTQSCPQTPVLKLSER